LRVAFREVGYPSAAGGALCAANDQRPMGREHPDEDGPGSALIVRGDVDRLTSDLDFFAPPDRSVDQLTAAFVAAAQEAGFEVEALQSGPTFASLLVCRGEEAVSADVGLVSLKGLESFRPESFRDGEARSSRRVSNSRTRALQRCPCSAAV
jgi:hypothetical protein